MNDLQLRASMDVQRAHPFVPDWVIWKKDAVERLEPLLVAICERHPEFTATDLEQEVWSIYGATAWAAVGFNVVQLTESLAAQLLLTEEDCEDVVVPFQCFDVHLPSAVPLMCATKRIVRLRVFATEYGTGLPMVAWWASFADGTTGNDSFVARSPRQYQGESARRIGQFIVNLCSWMTSGTDRGIRTNQKAVERAVARGDSWPAVWSFGHSVKLTRELRDAARAVAKGEQSPEWKLECQFWVRGHWRWQPIGERLKPGVEGPSNAKRLFIAPFRKGPDGAEAWQHVYKPQADAP